LSAAPPAEQAYPTQIDGAGNSDSKIATALVKAASLSRRPVKVITDTVHQSAVSPILGTSDEYLELQDIRGTESPKDISLDIGNSNQGLCSEGSGKNAVNKRVQYLSALENLDVAESAAGDRSPESPSLKGRWSGKFRRSNTINTTPTQGYRHLS
jgi:hypothetical protein